jgi:enediyne biosynthesis protein E4
MGPALATADINGDGLDDFYLGGSNGNDAQLYVQTANGSFVRKPVAAFASDINKEAADALFFDKDNDGDQDLFVVTGSNEYAESGVELIDLLYENNGKGDFTLVSTFPAIYENGSSVAAADVDNDKDIDLFVAGRSIPGKYGLSAASHLYINDGKGNFKNQTKRFFKDATDFGMITGAAFADINGDKAMDLVLAQDWGIIQVFENKNRKFVESSLPNSKGLWNSLKLADVDADGDMDIIAGNMGGNTKLKTSLKKQASLHVADFDNNGAYEQVMSCLAENNEVYPMLQKPDLTRAIPSLKNKFLKYIDYAGKTVSEIFTAEMMSTAKERTIESTATKLFLNDGKGTFTEQSLPIEVQFSNVSAIEVGEFTGDKLVDILLTGNFYDTLPEWGRTDANFGQLLQGEGGGKFSFVKNSQSGLMVKGQTRKSATIKTSKGKAVLFAKNNDVAQLYTNY